MIALTATAANGGLDNGPLVLDGGVIPSAASFGPQGFEVTAALVRLRRLRRRLGRSGKPPARPRSGKIALFDAPRCPFVTVVLNAADAGAAGVLITATAASGFVSMGGNANVSIPAQHIQRDAGVPLANRLDAGEAITVTMIRPFVADKDSALDNTIIAHEYAHFLTNRLVGDGNGLLNQSGKSLGEGWSDFFSLWMMLRASDAAVAANANWRGVFAPGAYAVSGVDFSGAGNPAYYLGARRYPYSVDLTRNGLSFRHLQLGRRSRRCRGGVRRQHRAPHGEIGARCSGKRSGAAHQPRFSFARARDRMLTTVVRR